MVLPLPLLTTAAADTVATGVNTAQLAESAKQLSLTIALFVPFHQAAVELWKLWGVKLARYYEALVYIIYGWVGSPDGQVEAGHLGVFEGLFSGARLVPKALGPAQRRSWAKGSEGRLMESFYLRGVGDSPSTEISGADIDNVVAIVRTNSPAGVRHVLSVLDDLLAGGIVDPQQVASALEALTPCDGLDDRLASWSQTLRSSESRKPPVGVLLHLWRQELLEDLLPGELRARTELANAFKAAEYRYHNDLTRASLVLALLEAAVITWLFQNAHHPPKLAWLLVPFTIALGGLLVLPRGTKGVLDGIIGIGARLAG